MITMRLAVIQLIQVRAQSRCGKTWKALTTEHATLSNKIRNLKGKSIKWSTISYTVRKTSDPQSLSSLYKYIEPKSENLGPGE